MIGMKTKSVSKAKVAKKKSGPKSSVKSNPKPATKHTNDVVKPLTNEQWTPEAQQAKVKERIAANAVTVDGSNIPQKGETKVSQPSPDPKAYNPVEQMAGTDAARKLGMKHTVEKV